MMLKAPQPRKTGMLLKRRRGNQESGIRNQESGMGIGEWGNENGKLKMGDEK